MRGVRRAVFCAVVLSFSSFTALRAERPPSLNYERAIKPLLVNYCHGCHNAEQKKGEIDLASFKTGDELAAGPKRLQGMLEAVREKFMPPENAKRQPTGAERKRLVDWIRERLHRIARDQAGDPGEVVVRRLTNAELNYTLNDLTGIERDWTKDFPRDGSGGEGFSNTGQTLQMSAAQIEKYLALAQRLSDHALLLPGSGPVFLETPVTTVPAAERARLTLSRLDDFCRARRLAYRDVTPRGQITSYAYPDRKGMKQKGYTHVRGYAGFTDDVPGATLKFIGSTFRLFYRTEKLNPTPFTFMIHRGGISPPGESPADVPPAVMKTWESLWLDHRDATRYARPAKISLLHRWFSHHAYRMGDNPRLEAEMKKWKIGDGKIPKNGKRHSLDPSVDMSFTVIALADYLDGIHRCAPEELRVYANIQHSRDGESRGLMVPNHDAFDAFLHHTLSDEQIEQLWRRVCDPQSRLAKRLGGAPPESMRAEWTASTTQQRKWREAALPSAQEAVCVFASRAWRRPPTDAERNAFRSQIARAMGTGQTLPDAMRLPLVRIFMSPHFLYHMEFGANAQVDAKSKVRPLNDFELANRLSYFLWSSMPDKTLWNAAARGELADRRNLAKHARRMLKDARIRRFSREMFGQWLGFYHFRELERPDHKRFPEFDAELRTQMFNEAIDFCTDLVANNRDIRLLLSADYAFLPKRLARHYGVEIEPNESAWTNFERQGDLLGLVTAPRISLTKTNRRGILGWGAMLTATSHPLRTSPVLRGNWILDDLLGIPTPPPPQAVPELPEDEKNAAGLSVAQLLARHRRDKACAVCHNRIDPFGLALESFDPIGRFRERDLNGQRIDTHTKLHDGTSIDGVAGLANYLQQDKQRRLLTRRFSRKILGYALGRAILPGDTPLLDEIDEKLNANQHRFAVVIDAIVTSRQFRFLKRESSGPSKNSGSQP